MQKLLHWLNSIQKYLLASILIIVPLFPKFPFLRIPGTYVSIRLEDLLIALVTLVFLVSYIPDVKKVFNQKIEKSVLIYLLIGLVSVISGIYLTRTVPLHIGILHWLRRVEYFLPFFLVYLYFKRNGSQDLEFFMKLIGIIILIAFVYGFGQKYFSWPVIITQNNEYSKGIALRWIAGSHINSTFAGHYDLASSLVLMLPLIVSSLFILKGKYTKLFLGLTLFAGLWLLTNAVSRISIVSYLLGIGLSLLLVKKFKAIILVGIISIAFFISSGGLWERYSRIIQVTIQNLSQKAKAVYNYTSGVVLAAETEALPQRKANTNSVTDGPSIFEDRSTSIRLNVEWPRAIRALKKNPLLGTGFSSITLATDNDFLRLLGETGILGFSSFILILTNIGILVKKVINKLKNIEGIKLSFVVGYIGALMGVLLNATFIDIFEASKFAILFWFITGMFVYLARNIIYEENN